MNLTIVLDSGPLGLISNPRITSTTSSAIEWALRMEAAGHKLVVPAIADYEVRRELIRSGKSLGLARLDAFNAAEPYRLLTVSDSALRIGATLWAKARNAGRLPSDPKDLGADVLIAAQAIDIGLPDSDYVIATMNTGHFSMFVPSRSWVEIMP